MINQLFAAFGPQGGAQGQGTGGNPMSIIFMIIAIFAVMYFLMIRPQQRQKKQQQDMLSAVSKGDKIVTIGGIHGTVAGIKDNTVIVKIADNVKIEVNRSAISQIVSSKSFRSQPKTGETKGEGGEKEEKENKES